jgi:hypothetical protein
MAGDRRFEDAADVSTESADFDDDGRERRSSSESGPSG